MNYNTEQWNTLKDEQAPDHYTIDMVFNTLKQREPYVNNITANLVFI